MNRSRWRFRAQRILVARAGKQEEGSVPAAGHGDPGGSKTRTCSSRKVARSESVALRRPRQGARLPAPTPARRAASRGRTPPGPASRSSKVCFETFVSRRGSDVLEPNHRRRLRPRCHVWSSSTSGSGEHRPFSSSTRPSSSRKRSTRTRAGSRFSTAGPARPARASPPERIRSMPWRARGHGLQGETAVEHRRRAVDEGGARRAA